MIRIALAAAIACALAPAARSACPPLAPPGGPVTLVTSAQAADLGAIVAAAAPGETIALADGIYEIHGDYLWIGAAGVSLRSESGNREAVVIDGNYEASEIVTVAAANVTVADLTIRRASTHPIHVVSTDEGDVTGTLIYNVHLIDPGQQAVKINPHAARVHFPDSGTVACSTIELTDAGRPHVWDINGSCYTGGIDGHQVRGWVVRDNRIEGFWCPEDISEHGVHFWNGARDTVVERNRIFDCARGVGFGLGESGSWRTYPDDPCPGPAGHYGGIVRNNFIFAGRAELFASEYGFDAGIALEQACGAFVLHNSVVSLVAPFSSIEWRFPITSATIANNAASHNYRPRDGASAELAGNLADAPLDLFADAAGGDLHLAAGAAVAIDQGVGLAAGLCDGDIDEDPRAGARDIGADEYGTPPPLLAIELTMNATAFGEGAPCRLDLAVENPGPERTVDLYVILDVFGSYFAYPSWAPATSALDHATRGFTAGHSGSLSIIPEFTMPAAAPAGPLRFHAALFEPGSLAIADLASNVSQWTFYLE